ncbi:hypothetical protein ACCT04_36710, partial [Rhizobium ruizarguesonis]
LIEFAGQSLRPHRLQRLVRGEPCLLERNEGFSRIVTGHADGQATLELQPMRKWRSPDALLMPVGEALAQFVCTEDFSTV